MGKVKKSVKKFLSKGGKDAPQKANKKRKTEAQSREKMKNKLSGDNTKKGDKTKKNKASSDHQLSNSSKSLEEMDVSDFMKVVGESDSESDIEEVDIDSDDYDSENDGQEEQNNSEEDEEEEDEDDVDSESDDDDDDVDELEESLSAHKQELEGLAEKDPEFYKYLVENNQDLLEFDGSDDEDNDGDNNEEDDDDEDDEDNEGGEVEEDEPKKSKPSKPVVDISLKDIQLAISHLKKDHSLRTLKKLLDMYRCGCNMGTETSNTSKYSIPSASIFNHLMVSSIQRLHVEFQYHLYPNDKENDNDKDEKDKKVKSSVNKSPNWSKLQPLLIAFFKSTLSLLRSVTDMSLGGFILKQLKHYSPFMVPFPKIIKKYLKLFLDLWGESQEHDVDSRSVQVAAFFRIRQLAIAVPFPFIEECLKGLYLTYVRNARFTNEQSIPVLTFMGNCIVELFGLDMKSSYSHGFVYIRQLALVLRNALIKKSKDSLTSVFNWQFLNSLRVWSAVVSQYPNKDELKDLVFPLVQVLMGVEKLAHSPRLVPFRLHCARLLNQLAASGCVFIPVSAILLDVLVSPELHKKPLPSTDLPLKLDAVIKLPEHLTAHEQDAVFNSALYLLHQTLDIYSYNPGFPEFSAAIKASLSSFAKSTKIAKWRAAVKGEIEVINKQALWVTQKRSALSSGPASSSNGGFELLLPTDKPNAAQRLEAANRAKSKAEQLANQQEAEYASKQKAKAEKAEAKQLKRKQRKEDKEDEALLSKKKKGHYQAAEEDVNDDVVEEGFDWDDDEEDQ